MALTQAISLLVGAQLGLGEEEMEVLGVAAVLHDTGKQAVSDELLLKSCGLTLKEHEVVSEHALHTEHVLKKILYPEHLRSVPMVAAFHHEKMDGTGTYGLHGDQLPIQARIIAVADAFERRCGASLARGDIRSSNSAWAGATTCHT